MPGSINLVRICVLSVHACSFILTSLFHDQNFILFNFLKFKLCKRHTSKHIYSVITACFQSKGPDQKNAFFQDNGRRQQPMARMFTHFSLNHVISPLFKLIGHGVHHSTFEQKPVCLLLKCKLSFHASKMQMKPFCSKSSWNSVFDVWT